MCGRSDRWVHGRGGITSGISSEPLLLLAIVTDRLTDEVGQESLWTAVFADDIVICSKSKGQVGKSLERSRRERSLGSW